MTALLWCEARCQGIYDHGYTYGCMETSEGAFGAREAAKEARQQGWRVVDGDWLCPCCIERRKRENAE